MTGSGRPKRIQLDRVLLLRCCLVVDLGDHLRHLHHLHQDEGPDPAGSAAAAAAAAKATAEARARAMVAAEDDCLVDYSDAIPVEVVAVLPQYR